MKLSMQTILFLLVAVLATFSLAITTEQKPVIVSYPDTTPDSVLDEAKAAIERAGGEITHSYKLIKAFAAKASEATLDKVETLGSKYNALIEEDKQVHAQDGRF